MPDLDLTGRSLTLKEYGDAGLAWFDRADQRETLDEAIAHAEARRLIERFAAGEPWEVIREQSRRGRPGEP
jgi:hypothetical protein